MVLSNDPPATGGSSATQGKTESLPRKPYVLGWLAVAWGSRKLRWRLFRIVLLSLLGMVMSVKIFEDRIIFIPSKYPEGRWDIAAQPAREGEYAPTVEDCWFTATDGVALHGWMCLPQQMRGGKLVRVPSQTVLLFFHGNAGNITDRYELIQKLTSVPARVFIIDYRGYGRSQGRPSEQGVYLDAQAAWKYLTNEQKITPDRIVLFGESLGGAVAIDLATKVNPAGLITQSTFTSIPDMAAAVLPHVPSSLAGLLLHTKMDSVNKIGQIACPKLMIHSDSDEVVPFGLGQQLFIAAAAPKQFHKVAGAGHNETDLVGGAEYLDAIAEFVHGLQEDLRPSGAPFDRGPVSVVPVRH